MLRRESFVGQLDNEADRTTILGGKVTVLKRIPRPLVEYGGTCKTIQHKRTAYPFAVSVSRVSSRQELLIRCIDIIGSIAILLATAPLLCMIALLIKLLSPGPVIYRQKRVGKNGEIFTLYKFRTMINNAERQSGPVLADKDDPRVTPIGRILRRTRLDEMPQLFNVLRGDMSLVGPRPERPYFVMRNKALQGIRLAVKPGITGLAQIRSLYNLRPDHKIRYDYLYIKKRSVLLNLYILLKTVPVVIFARNGW